MQHPTPAGPAVRDTLDRVLASETFARSDRARKLLKYLVEQEQDGRSDRLKGFSIAVDVFGRAEGFDPSTDAVVRVQAGRLRELLAQYLATEGSADPIRIVIPRGSYVPAYEFRSVGQIEFAQAEPNQTADPEPVSDVVPVARAELPIPANMMRHVRLFWATMAVVVALLGLLVYRGSSGQQDAHVADEEPLATSSLAAGDLAEMLPPVHLAISSDDPTTQRVAAVLRTAVSGFDTVDFIAHGLDSKPAHTPDDPIRFAFMVSAGPEKGTVTIELQSVATGKVLLSRVLAAADTEKPRLDDKIADIVSATLPLTGAIYAYIEQNKLQSGLTACLLLTDAYYLDQEPGNHQAAYRCLEKLKVAGARSPLVYGELAALHLEAVTDGYNYPVGATGEQALALARTAVLNGATSPSAHRAYGFLNSRVGSDEESIRWMKKAYELNTYDLTMAASYGYALIFAGDAAAGTPIIGRAVEESSAHPSWWDYGLFLGAYMLGDMDRASRAVEPLSTTKRSHYIAARIVVADAAGRSDTAAALVKELTDAYPKFAADPAASFRNGNYPTVLIEKFMAVLKKYGMGSAT